MMACLHAENFNRNFQISKKEYQTWLKKFRAAVARSGFISEARFSVVEQTVILRKK
jgi:truncated hemoglobin YjbI